MYVCLKSKTNNIVWYMDSGCLRHMTGDKKKFSKLDMQKGGRITYGDNSKGRIIGKGLIGKNLQISDVALVKGLGYNLLSVSQLCDKNLRVVFESNFVEVIDKSNEKCMFRGDRYGNIFGVDLDEVEKSVSLCLATLNIDTSWLWHRRL